MITPLGDGSPADDGPQAEQKAHELTDRVGQFLAAFETAARPRHALRTNESLVQAKSLLAEIQSSEHFEPILCCELNYCLYQLYELDGKDISFSPMLTSLEQSLPSLAFIENDQVRYAYRYLKAAEAVRGVNALQALTYTGQAEELIRKVDSPADLFHCLASKVTVLPQENMALAKPAVQEMIKISENLNFATNEELLTDFDLVAKHLIQTQNHDVAAILLDPLYARQVYHSRTRSLDAHETKVYLTIAVRMKMLYDAIGNHEGSRDVVNGILFKLDARATNFDFAADSLMELANLAYQAKKWELAIQLFEQNLLGTKNLFERAIAQTADSLNKMATAAMELGQFHHAHQRLQRSLMLITHSEYTWSQKVALVAAPLRSVLRIPFLETAEKVFESLAVEAKFDLENLSSVLRTAEGADEVEAISAFSLMYVGYLLRVSNENPWPVGRKINQAEDVLAALLEVLPAMKAPESLQAEALWMNAEILIRNAEYRKAGLEMEKVQKIFAGLGTEYKSIVLATTLRRVEIETQIPNNESTIQELVAQLEHFFNTIDTHTFANNVDVGLKAVDQLITLRSLREALRLLQRLQLVHNAGRSGKNSLGIARCFQRRAQIHLLSGEEYHALGSYQEIINRTSPKDWRERSVYLQAAREHAAVVFSMFRREKAFELLRTIYDREIKDLTRYGEVEIPLVVDLARTGIAISEFETASALIDDLSEKIIGTDLNSAILLAELQFDYLIACNHSGTAMKKLMAVKDLPSTPARDFAVRLREAKGYFALAESERALSTIDEIQKDLLTERIGLLEKEGIALEAFALSSEILEEAERYVACFEMTQNALSKYRRFHGLRHSMQSFELYFRAARSLTMLEDRDALTFFESAAQDLVALNQSRTTHMEALLVAHLQFLEDNEYSSAVVEQVQHKLYQVRTAIKRES